MNHSALVENFPQLMDQLRDGDEEAARLVFDRHVQPLIANVRRRLSAMMKRRLDPEDVVQSAFRSFFTHVQAGRYEFNDSGDLWRLLVKLTWHKLLQKVERETAGKRDVQREREPQPDASWNPETAGRSPTPESEAIVLDLIQMVEGRLTVTQRQIFELRLQGYLIEDIAAEVSRSERTVRRGLDLVKECLEECLADAAS